MQNAAQIISRRQNRKIRTAHNRAHGNDRREISRLRHTGFANKSTSTMESRRRAAAMASLSLV